MASEPYSAIEQSLIAQMQSGDEAAFTKILQRYQRPVLDFVYRMLGNADTAQDVAQEVFVRVLAGMQPNSDLARVFPHGGVILASEQKGAFWKLDSDRKEAACRSTTRV